MTFMEHVIADSMPLWQAAASCSFLEQMGRGTLEQELFLDYIIQDSLYLRDYLKAFAMGIVKSRSLKEMQVFYSVLGYVNDSENTTRLRYLAKSGLTDDAIENYPQKPACAAYTKFLLDTAKQEEIPEILMAVMPCMLGYAYVFNALADHYPNVLASKYAPLVQDYTSAGYQASCQFWTQYVNERCEPLDAQRKKKLTALFRAASQHELNFWEMAGNKTIAAKEMNQHEKQ
ncbi:MAG: TENA/THI-4 family protein [Clostridiales bacterium]|nr:TENA/THI-4 family protein [Clostridiales bacterium]